MLTIWTIVAYILTAALAILFGLGAAEMLVVRMPRHKEHQQHSLIWSVIISALFILSYLIATALVMLVLTTARWLITGAWVEDPPLLHVVLAYFFILVPCILATRKRARQARA